MENPNLITVFVCFLKSGLRFTRFDTNNVGLSFINEIKKHNPNFKPEKVEQRERDKTFIVNGYPREFEPLIMSLIEEYRKKHNLQYRKKTNQGGGNKFQRRNTGGGYQQRYNKEGGQGGQYKGGGGGGYQKKYYDKSQGNNFSGSNSNSDSDKGGYSKGYSGGGSGYNKYSDNQYDKPRKRPRIYKPKDGEQ